MMEREVDSDGGSPRALPMLPASPWDTESLGPRDRLLETGVVVAGVAGYSHSPLLETTKYKHASSSRNI
jgi:hypothetical protein